VNAAGNRGHLSPRQGQVKDGHAADFAHHGREVPLFGGEGTDI